MPMLEQNIIEGIKANQEAYLKEYRRKVRVTLLSEYEHNDGIVTMRYSSEDARVLGGANEDDELIDLAAQRPLRIVAGRPVHYHMSFSRARCAASARTSRSRSTTRSSCRFPAR